MSFQDHITEEFDEYRREAREVRAEIIEMTCAAGSGHPGSSFSSTDLLVWLYNEELDIDPADPDAADRDRLIFSKGHASPALYSVLARKGFFDSDELTRLRKTDALLQGHASHNIPGVEFSSGSLGQGLSFGVGTALSAKLDDHSFQTFVVLGDGELQEGNVWEAVMTAAHANLDNLVAIVEQNGIQNDGRVDETKALDPLVEKFEAFGWETVTCDGHDFTSIGKAFHDVTSTERTGPAVIIAETVKGKGVSFMEADNMGYHSQVLSSEEVEQAYDELDVEPQLNGAHQ